MANMGIESERRLLRELYRSGFVGVRTAGSGGGTKEPKPDVLAGKDGKQFAIELKTSNTEDIYIKDSQIEGLIEFAREFGAVPMVCVKFKRLPYVFMRIDDMGHTGGYSYHISKEEAVQMTNKQRYKLDDYT